MNGLCQAVMIEKGGSRPSRSRVEEGLLSPDPLQDALKREEIHW